VATPNLIELDGAAGEAGGQVLRTALALSAVTGRAFRVVGVRAGRPKPGLRPQHLAAARATAAICQGRLKGDDLGSMEILLEPQAVERRDAWRFDIGTAGSTPLLFQTLCWPLAVAGAPTELFLGGGTHQGGAPSFHYLALVWAPAVARLGFPFTLSLQRAGFYPEGGGEMSATIAAPRGMPSLDLGHRGTLVQAEVLSLACGVDFAVAERQAARAERRLRNGGVACEVRAVPMPCGPSRGSHLLVVATFERVRSGHAATSDGGVDPDGVADAAVLRFSSFLDGHGAVDAHLADQLLVPAALVAAGLAPRPDGVDRVTRFSVGEVTRHLLTNAEVIRAFLPVEVVIEGERGGEGTVRVAPRAGNGPAQVP
jgi:RNA 3'-terminal phosphate cyclase (ATP)